MLFAANDLLLRVVLRGRSDTQGQSQPLDGRHLALPPDALAWPHVGPRVLPDRPQTKAHMMCQGTAALRDFSTLHVRFGSKADIASCLDFVRFTPKADKQQMTRFVCFVPKAD